MYREIAYQIKAPHTLFACCVTCVKWRLQGKARGSPGPPFLDLPLLAPPFELSYPMDEHISSCTAVYITVIDLIHRRRADKMPNTSNVLFCYCRGGRGLGETATS